LPITLCARKQQDERITLLFEQALAPLARE
jgi:hypothetical protein